MSKEKADLVSVCLHTAGILVCAILTYLIYTAPVKPVGDEPYHPFYFTQTK